MNTLFSLHRLGCSLLATAVCMSAGAQTPDTHLWLKGGHAGKVNAVAWANNGEVIATASDDTTVKLWSTNGTLLQTLTTQPYQATTLAFSSDATKLAVGAYAGGYLGGSNGLGIVFIWQANNGWATNNLSVVRSLTNRFGKITAVAFSADGSKLASSVASGSNYVHQISNGTVLTSKTGYTTNKFISMETNAPVLGIAISANGLLASACEDGTVRVWNSAYTQLWTTNTAHNSNVTAVAFSPDGSSLASASLDGTIQLWTTNFWTCTRTLTGHVSGVTSIAFSPDGNRIVSGSEDKTVKVWSINTGDCLATANGHADTVSAVAFSPDGNHLVSGGGDNRAIIWSATDGALQQTFGSHADLVKAIAVSPDGTFCASAANDRTIQIRRITDGLLLQTLPANTGCVTAIAFAADNATLAASGGPLDPTIKLWHWADATLLRTIEASSNGVTALAFSADGATLASGSDCDERVIQLWNAADGSLERTLAGHSNGVTALAFSPNGSKLISGGRKFDNTIKVWNVGDGSLIRTFSGHSNHIESVAIAADGNTVASGSSGTNNLILWNIASGTARTFGTETNPVYFVAFTPDGGTLATAAKNAIRFWDVSSGSVTQTLAQETFRVSCLAYSSAGNLFAYGREDATIATFLLTSVSANNHAPIAGTDLYRRYRNISLRLSLTNLLGNDTDLDGDTLTLTSINLTTTNGVTLTTNATTIFYANPANVDDLFTYTITDNHGGSTTGTVSILMANACRDNHAIALECDCPGPATNTIALPALAGMQYVIQCTTNLATGPWSDLCTNVPTANGTWSVMDTQADFRQRYYRIVVR